MRCFTRAFRRSGVPLWYTEGFNPHPYMTFALPLPLGVESSDDVLDIRVDGYMENAEIIERLNAALPEGLSVTRAEEPWGKPGEIAFARYEYEFDKINFDAEKLREILSGGEIICERPGKQSGKKVMKQFNLAEHIKEFAIAENEECFMLDMTLAAGVSANVNPITAAEAILRLGGPEAKNIRRTALLTQGGGIFV